MSKLDNVCPKCLSRLYEHEEKIICLECGSEYFHGDTVMVPLSQLIKIRSEEDKIKQAKLPAPKKARITKRKRHSTGFYAVSRVKPRKGKPKGCWRYRSKAFDLNIIRVDLNDLKEDVLKKGGKWYIVDEVSAKKSMNINRRLHNAE